MDVRHIPLSEILADNDFNCRDMVNPTEVRELAANIEEHGLIQPVAVRSTPKNKKHTGKLWQLVAGYRRYTAFRILSETDPEKWGTIPAVVKECDDIAAFQINLSENIARSELNIKEEAKACGRLQAAGLTQHQIADRLGMSRGWVQNRLKMFDLPVDIQEEVVKLGLTPTTVNAIHALPTDDEKYEAVRKVGDAKLRGEKIKVAEQKPRNPDKKIIPKREDILRMMEQIGEICGWGFSTRLLAWVTGEVSDNDILGEARIFAANKKDAGI